MANRCSLDDSLALSSDFSLNSLIRAGWNSITSSSLSVRKDKVENGFNFSLISVDFNAKIGGLKAGFAYSK